ncbi:hypothetical protein BTZ20_4386 [Rhodococcus sp. MTM3W5.2]|nr:hypothetical protein BTZ20_4386 [Rhodococcus sp. MTM3W5.2]
MAPAEAVAPSRAGHQLPAVTSTAGSYSCGSTLDVMSGSRATDRYLT